MYVCMYHMGQVIWSYSVALILTEDSSVQFENIIENEISTCLTVIK